MSWSQKCYTNVISSNPCLLLVFLMGCELSWPQAGAAESGGGARPWVSSGSELQGPMQREFETCATVGLPFSRPAVKGGELGVAFMCVCVTKQAHVNPTHATNASHTYSRKTHTQWRHVVSKCLRVKYLLILTRKFIYLDIWNVTKYNLLHKFIMKKWTSCMILSLYSNLSVIMRKSSHWRF